MLLGNVEWIRNLVGMLDKGLIYQPKYDSVYEMESERIWNERMEEDTRHLIPDFN